MKNGMGLFRGKSKSEPSVWGYGFLNKIKVGEGIVYYIQPDVETCDPDTWSVMPVKKDTVCMCSGFLCDGEYIYGEDVLAIKKYLKDGRSEVFYVKATLENGGWWLKDLKGLEEGIYLYDISGYRFDGSLDVMAADLICKDIKYSVVGIVGNTFDGYRKELEDNN